MSKLGGPFGQCHLLEMSKLLTLRARVMIYKRAPRKFLRRGNVFCRVASVALPTCLHERDHFESCAILPTRLNEERDHFESRALFSHRVVAGRGVETAGRVEHFREEMDIADAGDKDTRTREDPMDR